MNPTASYTALTLSLGALLTVGGLGGYVLGKRRPPSAAGVSGQISTLPGTSPELWADQAFSLLSGDLQLTESQGKTLRPILETTAEKVFLERDRALLQMHLRLLEIHDTLTLEESLNEVQKRRLLESRAKLKASILSRFSTILRADEVTLPEL